jgi:hypothetical protein
VNVGTPYSQAARDAALAAIGGDSFPENIINLLQQLIVATCVTGAALSQGSPFSAAAQAEAAASIGGTALGNTIPDLLQQFIIATAIHGV